MGSRISRLFNGLILYVLSFLTFHIPVAEEVLFLHEIQASTGILYLSLIFLKGSSLIRHYTSRTNIFMYFVTIIQPHLYNLFAIPRCRINVCGVYTWPYVHTYGMCVSFRSWWPFQPTMCLLSTYLVWYVWWVLHCMSLWWRSRSRRLSPRKTEEDSR